MNGGYDFMIVNQATWISQQNYEKLYLLLTRLFHVLFLVLPTVSPDSCGKNSDVLTVFYGSKSRDIVVEFSGSVDHFQF